MTVRQCTHQAPSTGERCTHPVADTTPTCAAGHPNTRYQPATHTPAAPPAEVGEIDDLLNPSGPGSGQLCEECNQPVIISGGHWVHDPNVEHRTYGANCEPARPNDPYAPVATVNGEHLAPIHDDLYPHQDNPPPPRHPRLFHPQGKHHPRSEPLLWP